MDRKGMFQKLKDTLAAKKKAALWGGVGTAVVLVTATGMYFGMKSKAHATHEEVAESEDDSGEEVASKEKHSEGRHPASADEAKAKKDSGHHKDHKDSAKTEAKDEDGDEVASEDSAEKASAESHAKSGEHADTADSKDPADSKKSSHHEKSSAHEESTQAETMPPEHHASGIAGFFERIEDAWENVHEKSVAIQTAMEDNNRLRLENAHLRLKLESLEFDCHSVDASTLTREIGLKLNSETRTLVGRTLAGIPYKHPGHLLPPQLYTLGVSYFKGREDEKAAEILTFLTGLEENDSYKTPRNFLMTGVAWYRLDNLELADHYFEQVLKSQELPENAPYQAQARLWKALASERLSKHTKAQYWLRDLVDHHPYSTEAAWINGGTVPTGVHPRSGEVNRATASED